MNYSELHYILCIAKHQNLTRAAQELYISQPTLTKHLQKLERGNGGETLQPKWKYLCADLYRKKIHGIRP